jgi:predicted Zn finger-like uncharacterized protein
VSKPFVVRCPDCSAKLKLSKPPARGKKLRCPKCAEVFSPDLDEDEADAPDEELETRIAARPGRGASRPPRRRDYSAEEDDWDDEEPRPKKRKKDRNARGGRKGLWIGLGAGGAALVVAVVVLIIVLPKGGADPNAKPPNNPGGKDPENVAQAGVAAERLTEQFAALVDSVKGGDKARMGPLAKAFVIPNHREWFAKTFGEADGKIASADYEASVMNKNIELGLIAEMQQCLQKKQTQISAWKIEDPADIKATGNQKRILQKMKAPTPLYAVRFTLPGQTVGYRMDSFVFVDGQFRILGRLRSLEK